MPDRPTRQRPSQQGRAVGSRHVSGQERWAQTLLYGSHESTRGLGRSLGVQYLPSSPGRFPAPLVPTQGSPLRYVRTNDRRRLARADPQPICKGDRCSRPRGKNQPQNSLAASARHSHVPFTHPEPSVWYPEELRDIGGHASPQPSSPRHPPPASAPSAFLTRRSWKHSRDWERLLLPPGKSGGAELPWRLCVYIGHSFGLQKEISPSVAAPVMQKAGGCKECASSKINPGNTGGEGRQRQGDGQHRTDPKPWSLLRASVPFDKNLFPAWAQDSVCRSGVQTRRMDGLLDRSCVLPWTCCSAASLRSVLGLPGCSCGPGTPHLPGGPRSKQPPWCVTHNPDEMAEAFLHRDPQSRTRRGTDRALRSLASPRIALGWEEAAEALSSVTIICTREVTIF